MTKTEYLETKIKRDKLKTQLQDFELGFPPYDEGKLFETWQKWQKLSEQDKQAIKIKWDAYYKAVEDGYFGQKRREAAHLLKTGQTAKLKTLIEEVKVHPYDLIKPTSIDPEELERKMWGYFTAKSTLSKCEELVEQYAPIYETKKQLAVMDL